MSLFDYYEITVNPSGIVSYSNRIYCNESSRPKPKSFETETRPETIETETKTPKNGSRDRDQVSRLHHWLGQRCLPMVVCAGLLRCDQKGCWGRKSL